jgi:hypothetical protein
MRISCLGKRLLAFQKGLCCTSYRRLLKVGVRKPSLVASRLKVGSALRHRTVITGSEYSYCQSKHLHAETEKQQKNFINIDVYIILIPYSHFTCILWGPFTHIADCFVKQS